MDRRTKQNTSRTFRKDAATRAHPLFFFILLCAFLVSSSFTFAEPPGNPNNNNNNNTPSAPGLTLLDLQRYVERVGYVEEVGKVRQEHLFVGGTEYCPGEEGKAFVVLASDGQPVNNASCLIEIFYPLGGEFVEYSSMSFLEDGIYYYDFEVPNTTGVYPIEVICSYEATHQRKNATTATRIFGVGAGSVTDTFLSNDAYMRFDESGGTTRKIGGQFNYTGFNKTGLILNSMSLFIELRRVQGGSPAGDVIRFYFYDYVLGQYVQVGTNFSYNVADTVYTFTQINNISNYIDANGSVSVYFNDTINSTAGDTHDSDLYVDFANVEIDATIANSSITTVAGGGEVHVRGTNICGGTTNNDVSQITFDSEIILLLIWLLFLFSAVAMQHPTMTLISGVYGIMYGLVLIGSPSVSLFVAVVITFIGLLLVTASFIKPKRGEGKD